MDLEQLETRFQQHVATAYPDGPLPEHQENDVRAAFVGGCAVMFKYLTSEIQGDSPRQLIAALDTTREALLKMRDRVIAKEQARRVEEAQH